MTERTLNVVDFPVPDYRDPVKMLRNLAGQIEAGDFGEVGTIAIAIFGDTLEVFGGGPDSDGPTCALVFQAASFRFAKEIESHGQ